MNSTCPISILIPTRNEGTNIEQCVRSCSFANEVVVVDSGSTDDTVDIAQRLGARVVQFQWNGSFPKKKNWALETVAWRNEWVYILDADERITPELAEELRKVLRTPNFDGYYVNRRFWFIDGWLNHCGYYPSWNMRLFRHRLGRYERLHESGETQSGDNEVHEHVILQGRAGRLNCEMEHYAFPTIGVWVEKHNRYSNWEARVMLATAAKDGVPEIDAGLARKRRLKNAAAKMPFRPLLRFCYHYFLRAGFLDGYRGYVFCRLMAFYEFLSVHKAREIQRTAAR